MSTVWRIAKDAPTKRFSRIVAIDYATGQPRIAERTYFTDAPDDWVWTTGGIANFHWWVPVPPRE